VDVCEVFMEVYEVSGRFLMFRGGFRGFMEVYEVSGRF